MKCSTVLTLLTFVATTLAVPAPEYTPPPKQNSKKHDLHSRAGNCGFDKAASDLNSVCQPGSRPYCTGNTNMCSAWKTDTFTEEVTEMNARVCEGKKVGEKCKQTAACCP